MMSIETTSLSTETMRKPLGNVAANKTASKSEIDLSVRKPHQRLNKAIQSGRLAKKMSQKDVAKAVNVKPQVYADWETGKAIPGTAAIGKLENLFGRKLPGPGTPAAEKKTCPGEEDRGRYVDEAVKLLPGWRFFLLSYGICIRWGWVSVTSDLELPDLIFTIGDLLDFLELTPYWRVRASFDK